MYIHNYNYFDWVLSAIGCRTFPYTRIITKCVFLIKDTCWGLSSWGGKMKRWSVAPGKRRCCKIWRRLLLHSLLPHFSSTKFWKENRIDISIFINTVNPRCTYFLFYRSMILFSTIGQLSNFGRISVQETFYEMVSWTVIIYLS